MAQIEAPNVFGQFLAGKKIGEEERRQRTLSDFIQPALGGDQSALAKVYGADPNAGLQVQGMAQKSQAAGREQDVADLQQAARLYSSAPPEMRDHLYSRIVDLTEKVGIAAPGSLPRQHDPAMDANFSKFLAGIAGDEQGYTLAPGSKRFDSSNQLVAEAPFSPDKPQFQVDADGNGYWIAPGQAPRPVNGGQQAGGFGIAETDKYVQNILGNAQGLDPNAPPEQQAEVLLPHLIQQESGGNPNAVSPKGAQGLTQVMPATARDPGFGVAPMQGSSPQENVRFGRDYLTAMLKRYPGRPDLALAAYNAGPGVADRFSQPQAQAGGIKFPTKGNASTEDKAANWQIVQGQDGTFYRVNKLTGETASSGVQGANALRMQDQHQKRADAVAGIEGAIRSTDETLQSLDLLLSHPGRGSGTGMSAMLPAVPGSDRKNFDAQLATFKAQTFIPMVAQLKGMGALSDAEGKRLMDAVGALDPQMGEDAFAASLNRIKAQLLRAQAAAYQKISALKRNQAPDSRPTAPASDDDALIGKYL